MVAKLVILSGINEHWTDNFIFLDKIKYYV